MISQRLMKRPAIRGGKKKKKERKKKKKEGEWIPVFSRTGDLRFLKLRTSASPDWLVLPSTPGPVLRKREEKKKKKERREAARSMPVLC